MSKANPEITPGDIEDATAPKKPFVDQETVRAYSEYLADWRWRMSTFAALQREYMGPSAYVRYDNIF
jgi:hypothetical protein